MNKSLNEAATNNRNRRKNLASNERGEVKKKMFGKKKESRMKRKISSILTLDITATLKWDTFCSNLRTERKKKLQQRTNKIENTAVQI